jgi:hypothetical protein
MNAATVVRREVVTWRDHLARPGAPMPGHACEMA